MTWPPILAAPLDPLEWELVQYVADLRHTNARAENAAGAAPLPTADLWGAAAEYAACRYADRFWPAVHKGFRGTIDIGNAGPWPMTGQFEVKHTKHDHGELWLTPKDEPNPAVAYVLVVGIPPDGLRIVGATAGTRVANVPLTPTPDGRLARQIPQSALIPWPLRG